MAGDVNLKVSADPTGLTAALGQALDAVKGFSASASSSIGGLGSAFTGLQGIVVGLGAALGAALFTKAIDDTKKFTEESINLGKSLGISASEASGYALAIRDVGGTTDDFASATTGLTRQLRTHESALNDMGIKTRDASGNVRDMNDLMLDAINVVNSYAEGTDRNLAAQTAFGRGAQATSAIFRLTKDDMDRAKQSAIDLGLVVGEQNVKDFEANRVATAEAGNVLLGLKKAVGDTLMPVLTQLEVWFREAGPTAIGLTRTAMADLATVFWSVEVAVKAVWDIMMAMVASTIEPLKGMGAALYDALHGNWDKVKQDLVGIGTAVSATWQNTFDKIAASASEAGQKIKQAFADPATQAAAAATGGNKTFNLEQKPPGRQSVEKRESGAGAAKEISDDEKVLDMIAQQREEAALGDISAHEKMLDQELKDGQINAQQFLAQENAAIDQRLAVVKKYYDQKMIAAEGDLVEETKIQLAITKAEADATKQRQEAENRAQQAQMAQWKQLGNQIKSSLASNLTAMLEGTKTFAQGIKSLFASLIDSIIQIFVQMAVTWAANQLAAKLIGKKTGQSQIATNAGIAATAAMASVAAIPVVGWAMAPGVGQTTFATAIGYETALSAAGGFDIPAGLNPVTQLHQREMVLPADLAENVRNMTGSGGDTHLHVHTIDAASFKRYIDQPANRQAIATALGTHFSRGGR